MRATTKVVGMVAGGRQHIAATASPGDPVLLLPEPDNPHDANAIAVYTAPIGALQHPGDVVSSLKDPAGVGRLHPEDRALMVDRQAGYVPASVNKRFDLPADGIVGYVADVRYAPPEYDANGRQRDPRVAGFDVTAWWPQRDPAEARR